MAIRERIVLTKADGGDIIPFGTWAEHWLPADEYAKFLVACKEHNDYVASKATSVNLVEGINLFENSDALQASKSKTTDFHNYWYHYCTSQGITVEVVHENI